MARQPRIVVPGCPHHVTQRGNNRQDVFLLDDDRRFYLATLGELCRREKLRLLGYCLMTNHVHLVAIPDSPTSLARGVGGANFRYTLRFNRRYQRSGHLWQNRFYSFALGRDHLLAALAYVDLNPVRAGMERRAADYPFSSAAAHRSGRGPERSARHAHPSPSSTAAATGRSCWPLRNRTKRASVRSANRRERAGLWATKRS